MVAWTWLTSRGGPGPVVVAAAVMVTTVVLWHAFFYGTPAPTPWLDEASWTWDAPANSPLLRVPHRYCIDPELVTAFDEAELERSVVRATRWWQFEAGVALMQLYNAEPANNRASSRDHEPDLSYDHRRFAMLGPVGPACKSGLESYGAGDSEKRACGLALLSSHRGQDCHVVSIGSKNQWGFEEAIYHATRCRISTFDCTVGEDAAVPAEISSRTTLYRLCAGDADTREPETGREFRSWPSLLRAANLSGPPTHLKMDIEGFEYAVMRSILRAGVLLPEQISMEIHYSMGALPGLDWSRRRLAAGELALFMRELFDVGSYLLIDRHDNEICPYCSEVVLKRFACPP